VSYYQFIDHDLTFDPMPIDCAQTGSPNLRSRFFDLDSVSGRGPRDDRLLYDRASELDRGAPIKFFVDCDAPRDLPRTSQERAIIADSRNDENVIISQLHLAFLLAAFGGSVHATPAPMCYSNMQALHRSLNAVDRKPGSTGERDARVSYNKPSSNEPARRSHVFFLGSRCNTVSNAI